ncbi:hypothetical protein EV182_007083 [Spiromyces aspiralis]|uniref:Uncharacterized protein n=1 Tax=Spiromyces aspiralis TaxID=68401 RepID=A0ACC1HKM1_9FUNG|nr:hypothetical protein EV182_007083 [Spiromyces aspiralis]
MFNDTGETAGYLPRGYSEYIGRNMVLNGPPLYQTVLDGTEFTDPAYPVSKLVQPGAYYVQIDALRPFGDVDTEADYQSWRSPSFILRSVNVTVPIGNNLTLSFVPS